MQKLNINIAESGKAPIRRRLDPDTRRAQLLEHAMSAFADAGIERAVHADVAERANVSTPTVFKYFPTRVALVDAVFEEIENSILGLANLLPENVRLTPAEILRALAGVISSLCAHRPNLMKVALSWSVASSSVSERYTKFENDKLHRIREFLVLHEKNSSDARIIFGCMIFFARMHFDGTSADFRRDYIFRVIELFEAAPTPTKIG